MTKPKRGVQNSRQAYIPVPGDGVHFPWSKPNAKESKRIDMIVRVARAITQWDTDELVKLKKECKRKGCKLLEAKISKALKG